MLPEHSRTSLAKLIESGAVLVDGRARKPSFHLESGADVAVSSEPEAKAAHDLTPADIALDVPYEDDTLMVVSKPRGLATHPATSLKEPSLVNALLGRFGALSSGSAAYRPGIVHRLDKETTGLMIVAKTDRAHVNLARQIADRSAVRIYLAVVHGEVERADFSIEAPIGRDKKNRQRMTVDSSGKPALTHVKRFAKLPDGTLVAARLATGRTHQIRVHLSAVGHPVLGDRTYSLKRYEDTPLQLHAAFLAFSHPSTGERIACYQPPPLDFLGHAQADEHAIRVWAEP